MSNQNTIIVTGAGGYIGGQTAIALHDAGYKVIGIDNVHPPTHLSASTYFTKFFVTDFDSEESISMLVKENPVAIVHCAGTSLVGPSKKNPALYYQNNFVATKNLVEHIVQNKLQTRLIFSSSAATYGEPIMTPLQEVDPQQPINPYGQSKLMVEMMLESYRIAYGLDYVGFRYFNVCGADSQVRHGQAPGATHIIARVLEASRDKKQFKLFGTKCNTLDGTCIRDYIHVEDIAKAHLLAIQHAPSGFYNLGTGTGYSNREIVNTAIKVTGVNTEIVEGPMREGDPEILTGSSEKFSEETGWNPQHTLQSIVTTAWDWYNKGD